MLLGALFTYVIASYLIWIFLLPLIAWIDWKTRKVSPYFGVIIVWMVGIPVAPIALPYAVYRIFIRKLS